MAPSQFTVAILPLGDVSAYQVELTEFILQTVFKVQTLILPQKEIPARYFNAQRNRYNGYGLLDFLSYELPDNAQRIMGVTEKEIENYKNEPSWGHADFRNRTAIYSAPFLSEKNTSNPENGVRKDLLCYHLIAHEFAHTLGIDHCEQSNCIMHRELFGLVMCERCRRWADRELRVQPGSAEERFSLAETLYLRNCLPQAITLYREAIRLAPREPLYYHCLYIALEQLEQFDQAKLNLTSAIIHANDSNGFNYVCGLTLLRTHLKEAEEYFAQALAVSEDPQKTHRLIGQAYREVLHDVERASRHYKEYLKLGGNDQDVIDWLISRSQLDQV